MENGLFEMRRGILQSLDQDMPDEVEFYYLHQDEILNEEVIEASEGYRMFKNADQGVHSLRHFLLKHLTEITDEEEASFYRLGELLKKIYIFAGA